MDDPRFQQFFGDPQLTAQRRYEAIRAVILDGQPLQATAVSVRDGRPPFHSGSTRPTCR
jgi:hypothetical protein